MAPTIELPGASGYLARPTDGRGPRVLVIQEWWGLNDQIRGVCDRLAAAGIVALAPDLYHGEVAGHDEMDKAGELMAALPQDRAAEDMRAALEHLHNLDGDPQPVGVVGFCMGGALAWVLGTRHPELVGAVVPFYGAPLDPAMAPDWSGLQAPVLAHVAEADEWFPLAAMTELADKLVADGKDVTVHTYPGTGHAFANEENPLGTYDPDAAQLAWQRTIEFLKAKLAA